MSVGKDIHLSKTLSWLLRHGALKEGLQISKEGFVKVTDVLDHKNLRNKYSLDDIRRVVDTNDKQRFSLRFNDDVWEICANQGHSLKDVEDPNLIPIVEANNIQAIHGTYYKNWHTIKKEGLSRMKRNHIHFAPGLPGEKAVISGMRKTAEIFIYINLPLALSNGITFFKSANNVILSPGDETGLINPKYFLKGSRLYAMYTGTKRKCDRDMEESDQKVEVDALKKAKLLMCEWCKVELSNEAAMRQHLLGQKHKNFHDAKEDRRRVEQKCGLFIRGFGQYITKDVILAYFSKFGKIVWVHFDRSFLLLDYDEPAVAENVKNRSHYLGGHRLMVNYRKLRKPAPIGPPKQDVETNNLIEIIKAVPNFCDQIRELCLNLQPIAQQQFPKYNRICEDLFNVFQLSYPFCRIHPFGSTITGLGFNTSDVDVYVSGVRNGSKDIRYLYKSKSLLLASQLFTNVLAIPQAKIPILKCIHVATGINCDINMKNMLGVCNSQLINYYMNLDPKIRQLMIVLKFWAKTHGITGQSHLFTNYSLSLMLIFFLQHSPFYVPSVVMLHQNPQFFSNHDGWNGGFEPVHFVSSELSGISQLELLRMFYEFYIDYEYGVRVICPYMGLSVMKQLLKEPERLPEHFRMYKQYVAAATEQPLRVDTPVCVQDPFEHTRNTTSVVSIGILERFVSFCRLGKKICEGGDGPILFKLLTEVPPNLVVLGKVGANQGQLTPFTISMRPGMKYIEEAYETNSERHKAWFEGVVRFTRIVLKDFLKLDLRENDAASKTKHKKAEGQTDVYDDRMRICFKCSGKLNLWDARKSIVKNALPKGVKTSVVQKEMEITEQLCSLCKNICLITEIINFEISLEHFSDPPKVVIDIKKISAYKNCFKTFLMFFSANLPAWFKTFEQEQNESV